MPGCVSVGGMFATNAWNENFTGSNSGRQNNNNKTNTNSVRPVRR